MRLLAVLVSLFALVSSELLHVHVLFRHGDRTPMGPIYPKDPHQAEAWPEGLGQLTKVGARQAYNLGRYLRNRYHDFLSPHYNHSEIYIRSSNHDRALMTAQACLSGLFLPSGPEAEFMDGLKWNPVPVHTVAEDHDELLLMRDCPRVAQLMAKVYKSPEAHVNKINEDNKELFKKLGEATGLHHFQFRQNYRMYDTMFCERAHNLSQPEFVTPEVWKKIEGFAMLEWKLWYSDHKLKQLRGGILLHEVLENIKARAHMSESHYPETRKMKVYSAHDTTVSAYLAAAGVYNELQPPYTATVLTELHKEGGIFYVRLFYRNDTEEARLLGMPGCTDSCPLSKLIELWTPNVMLPWRRKAECAVTSSSNSRSMITAALSYTFGFISVVGLFCILFFIVRYMMRRRNRYRRYSRLDAYVDGESMVNLNSGS